MQWPITRNNRELTFIAAFFRPDKVIGITLAATQAPKIRLLPDLYLGCRRKFRENPSNQRFVKQRKRTGWALELNVKVSHEIIKMRGNAV